MSVVNLFSSTSKNSACLEFPKLSTADRLAISSPSEGLVVYDTTDKNLQYYDGTNWAGITGATSGSGVGCVCSFKLVASENYPASSTFPLGSVSPNNFVSSFSTFPNPVNVVSGLFTLPTSGVYRISISCHVSVATTPSTGTLILKLVNGANTTTYTTQYPSCISTAFPTNFNYNFEYLGQFTAGNTLQCLVQNTSNGVFSSESLNNGTVVSFEQLA